MKLGKQNLLLTGPKRKIREFFFFDQKGIDNERIFEIVFNMEEKDDMYDIEKRIWINATCLLNVILNIWRTYLR